MARYYVYLIDPDGRVASRRAVDAADDREAIARGGEICAPLRPHAVEIWIHQRLVLRSGDARD